MCVSNENGSDFYFYFVAASCTARHMSIRACNAIGCDFSSKITKSENKRNNKYNRYIKTQANPGTERIIRRSIIICT